MSALWTIAANTFRENRRDRVLYVLLLFAVLMIGAGAIVGELSPFEQSKILLDLGQSVMALAGALIAIFLGISLVSKEIEKRTIYVVICKPVSRTQFLLGKVLGLVMTLTAAHLVMGAILALVTWGYGTAPGLPLLQSVVLIWVQLVLLIALAVTFASFSSTMLSAMFTIGTWIIGQVVGDLATVAARSESTATRVVLGAVYWVMPNLALFDVKARATYGIPISAAEFSWSAAYGACYITALLCVASLVFTHRDFR